MDEPILNYTFSLTLFKMCIFGAAHGLREKVPHLKICFTNPAIMKLGAVIPYIKNIQKIYETRDTPLVTKVW